jgi:hypothetical protein
MGKYPLSASEQAQFNRMWNGMTTSRKATALIDFDHFCSWIREADNGLYYKILGYLRQIYEDLKKQVEDVLNEVGEAIGDTIEGCIDLADEGIKALKKFFS